MSARTKDAVELPIAQVHSSRRGFFLLVVGAVMGLLALPSSAIPAQDPEGGQPTRGPGYAATWMGA